MPPQSSKDNQEQLYKKAFDEVVEHYQGAKHSSSLNGIKSLDYSKMEQSGANTANIVKASPIDFVCDVETTVRRALEDDTNLFNIFLNGYVYLSFVPDTASPEIDRLRRIVGRAFISRQLYPVAKYLKPKHLDRSKSK